jgi:hypothetical protein
VDNINWYAMKDAHKLKSLQVAATNIAVQIRDASNEARSDKRRIDAMRKELESLNHRIESFSRSKPVVTEHAMLRYLERVIGIDLNTVSAAILTEQNRKLIDFSNGNCRIKSDGVEFVVKGRKVISVVS